MKQSLVFKEQTKTLQEKVQEEGKSRAALEANAVSLQGKLDNAMETLERSRESRDKALDEVESLKAQLADANSREADLRAELDRAVAEARLEAVEQYKNGLGKEAIEAAIASFRKYAVEMYPEAVEQTLFIARQDHGYTGPDAKAYPKKLNHKGFLWEKYKLVPSDEEEAAEEEEEDEDEDDEDVPADQDPTQPSP